MDGAAAGALPASLRTRARLCPWGDVVARNLAGAAKTGQQAQMQLVPSYADHLPPMGRPGDLWCVADASLGPRNFGVRLYLCVGIQESDGFPLWSEVPLGVPVQAGLSSRPRGRWTRPRFCLSRARLVRALRRASWRPPGARNRRPHTSPHWQSLALVLKLAGGAPAATPARLSITPPPGGGHRGLKSGARGVPYRWSR